MAPSKLQTTDSSSIEEVEEEVLSEGTDSELGDADPTIKPLASKPMDDQPPKTSRSKNPTSRYSPPPLKSVARKPPAPETERKRKLPAPGTEPKRAKVVVALAAPDFDRQKKQPSHKLWSDEDEVNLMTGMITYIDEKGKDPIADMNNFFEYVKASLNVDVNIRQLTDKVRKLKAKYTIDEGNVKPLSKPHERKMHELCEKLWGSDQIVKNEAAFGSSPRKIMVNRKNMNVQSVVLECMNTEEDVMKKGFELMSGAKKVELEEKWNDLKVQQLEHFLKKLEVLQEQGQLVLNAIKKSIAN